MKDGPKTFHNRVRWTLQTFWRSSFTVYHKWDIANTVIWYCFWNARLKHMHRIDNTTSTSTMWCLLILFQLYVGDIINLYPTLHQASWMSSDAHSVPTQGSPHLYHWQKPCKLSPSEIVPRKTSKSRRYYTALLTILEQSKKLNSSANKGISLKETVPELEDVVDPPLRTLTIWSH